MIVLLVASRSKASAVMPTVVPTITFSVTSSVARIDIGRDRDIEFVDVVDRDVERLAGDRSVAAGRLDRDRAGRAVRFAIDRRGGGDHAGVGVDGEQSVGVAGQAVGDRVVGRVQIEGVGGDADRRADDHVFGHFVRRGIDIGRHRDIEFVDVVDGDRNDLIGERSVGDVARTVMLRVGSVGFAVDRSGDGDHAGVGVDGEPTAVVVLQRVGDRVGRRVGVAGRRR